jgi:hypothetical protein
MRIKYEFINSLYAKFMSVGRVTIVTHCNRPPIIIQADHKHTNIKRLFRNTILKFNTQDCLVVYKCLDLGLHIVWVLDAGKHCNNRLKYSHPT